MELTGLYSTNFWFKLLLREETKTKVEMEMVVLSQIDVISIFKCFVPLGCLSP